LQSSVRIFAVDTAALDPGSDGFSIRLATPADLEPIYEIWREGAQDAAGSPYEIEMEQLYRRVLARRIPSDNHDALPVVWVAVDGSGVVLGWQSLVARSNPINYLHIAESSTYVRRKTGVPRLGESLAREALRYARETAIEYIYVFSTSDNRASKILMKRLGFEPVGQVPKSLRNPHRTPLEFWVYRVPA
jgi:L-amino acid N-acyltransferase YncA